MSRLTAVSLAANAVLLTVIAARLDLWALLPWALLGLSLALLVATARHAERRSPAQFVVLRGRVGCPECAYLLDLDDKHCAKCGYAVSEIKSRITCGECRARNWEDDVHCRQCGHKIITE